MNGWVDVVRIEDGGVVLSKELKHIAGNITMIQATGRPNEVMLGTQRGVYFAHVGRGLGLMEVEMERFDKQSKFAKTGDLRVPEGSERAELTTAGPKYQDLDGLSQMTFHTQSQFGRAARNAADADADGRSSQASQSHTVYTKPFTVQSNKSEKSKMQQSVVSKAGTEMAKGKAGIVKQRAGAKSNVPDKAGKASGDGSQDAMGTVAQTRNSEDMKSKVKTEQKSMSILKKSGKQPMGSKNGGSGRRTEEVAESLDVVMVG